jgi:hypothetical protein
MFTAFSEGSIAITFSKISDNLYDNHPAPLPMSIANFLTFLLLSIKYFNLSSLLLNTLSS